MNCPQTLSGPLPDLKDQTSRGTSSPKVETFRGISARRELTFESLGTSLINLFGKKIFGESRRQKPDKNSKDLLCRLLLALDNKQSVVKLLSVLSAGL